MTRRPDPSELDAFFEALLADFGSDRPRSAVMREAVAQALSVGDDDPGDAEHEREI